jgi:hypothetical protein
VRGPGAEQVLDERYRPGADDAERSDVAVGPRADRPRPVGEAIQRPVVERDKLPVRGRPSIGLEVGIAQLHSVLERGPRVLWRVGRAAAMREGDRARVVEVRNSHDRSMPADLVREVDGGCLSAKGQLDSRIGGKPRLSPPGHHWWPRED